MGWIGRTWAVSPGPIRNSTSYLLGYGFSPGGSDICVAGTNRRSMHSYAAAIDIATAHADYWQWSGGEDAAWKNRIPIEIVQIFERHGFIWGGKWYHYDTMHFEYRPELLPVTAAP